jgi:hypothetical protein
MVPDEPPRVEIRLRGISTAVTPDVIIPVEGVIMDDYAVDETWFDVEMQRPGQEPDDLRTTGSRTTSPGDGATVDASLDFRALRSRETEPLGIAARTTSWSSRSKAPTNTT